MQVNTTSLVVNCFNQYSFCNRTYGLLSFCMHTPAWLLQWWKTKQTHNFSEGNDEKEVVWEHTRLKLLLCPFHCYKLTILPRLDINLTSLAPKCFSRLSFSSSVSHEGIFLTKRVVEPSTRPPDAILRIYVMHVGDGVSCSHAPVLRSDSICERDRQKAAGCGGPKSKWKFI